MGLIESIFVVGILTTVLIGIDNAESHNINKFLRDNNCVETQYQPADGYISFGIAPANTATGFGTTVTPVNTPSRTGYTCKDGKTYWF